MVVIKWLFYLFSFVIFWSFLLMFCQEAGIHPMFSAGVVLGFLIVFIVFKIITKDA